MTEITSKSEMEAYTTKDGSLISELMHPVIHGNSEQSLAEARVNPGDTTALHYHEKTEELYHILEGQGVMTLGEESFNVKSGDTICIHPGVLHRIRNSGEGELVFLCCCSPAYSHEDTWLDSD